MEQQIHSIRYPFGVDSGAGQLAEERNYYKHIEQLMMQVLFTAPGERINRPDFGCGLRRMVFAPNTPETANLTRVMIFQALERWLATVIEVFDVEVTAIEERLDVKIVYLVKARQERRYLNIEVAV